MIKINLKTAMPSV